LCRTTGECLRGCPVALASSGNSLTLGLMGKIIWPTKAHRGATRPANRLKARRRQLRSSRRKAVDRRPMPGHRNPTPESSCSLQRMEAGFWVEHLRLFRNADTESARYPNAAGCRNPRSAHKIRGDEPGALDPSDKLALFHENFLPETASTSQQSRHTLTKMLPNQPNKLQLLPPLSDYAVPHAPTPTK
jgi:hypothetical protein